MTAGFESRFFGPGIPERIGHSDNPGGFAFQQQRAGGALASLPAPPPTSAPISGFTAAAAAYAPAVQTGCLGR
jgi:hypothetical protein